jgi:hypothetical protein
MTAQSMEKWRHAASHPAAYDASRGHRFDLRICGVGAVQKAAVTAAFVVRRNNQEVARSPIFA